MKPCVMCGSDISSRYPSSMCRSCDLVAMELQKRKDAGEKFCRETVDFAFRKGTADPLIIKSLQQLGFDK